MPYEVYNFQTGEFEYCDAQTAAELFSIGDNQASEVLVYDARNEALLEELLSMPMDNTIGPEL